MSNSPSGPTRKAAQPSVESARATAFRTLARLAVGGGLTLGEYAECAVAIQQAATTGEIEALQKVGAPARPLLAAPVG